MNSPRTKFSVVLLLFTFAVTAQVRSQVGNNNPTGPTGEFNGNVTTGCSYDPYTGNATRMVTDMVVAGAVGKYGLSYSRTWNSRNVYAGWAGSYDWSIDSLGDMPPGGTSLTYTVHFPDGRTEVFYGTGSNPLSGGPGIREYMKPYNGSICSLLLPDGGKIEFKVTKTFFNDPELIPSTWCTYDFQVQAIIDPYGQRTTYTYNADGSTTITEPAGRWIKIFYTTINYVQFVDYIQASDGRFVDYNYQPGPYGYTVLSSVGYYGNTSPPYNYVYTATYTYQGPNGTGGSPLLKTCDDPMYAGPMKRIGYVYATGTNADGTAVVCGQILSENYYDGINPNALGAAVTTLSSVNGNSRTETRADGKTRTFTYSASGFLTGATDFRPTQIAQTQTYDTNSFVNAVTDRNGHTTNFTNNSIGAVTQIQYPLTPSDTLPANAPRGTVTYTYGWVGCPDPNNQDAYHLYSITDEGGNVTRLTRDTSKRITRVDFPDTGYETFAYNSFGQVTSHLMRTGGTETFTYDSRGLIQTYRSPDNPTGNPTARFQNDALDRVSGVTDVFGSIPGDVNHSTSYAYNNRGQILTTTLPTDPIDNARYTIQNTYNSNGDGTLTSVTDQLGHLTSYTYDDYRRPLSVTTPGHNTPQTAYSSYDVNQGTGIDYRHTDANVTRLTLPSGNIVKTHYDENYRKDSVSASAGDGIADAASTTYFYDNVGNVTSIRAPNQQPSGPSTVSAYDERNRLMSVTDALGKVTSFTYDAAGRKKIVTRPNGQTVTIDTYDAMNRVLQQTVKQTPDPDAVTKYTYYTSGLLNTMQDPRLVALNSTYKYTYVYDQMGRKTSLTFPPDGSSNSRSESFTYDLAGRPATFTKAYPNQTSLVQTFSYDALNRTTGFTWSDNPTTPNVTFGYDVASRLTSIINANATITRAYCNDNLLNTEIQNLAGAGGPSKTVTYTYNADGNRATVQYPDNGYSFTYDYTGRNQLKSVANTATPTVSIAAYLYDFNGNLTSRSLDNSTSSGYGYDVLNRATSISHALNATTRTFNYGYDNVGNRLWSKRESNMGDVFGYDLNDQVTATLQNIASPDFASVGSQTINYDANGNRTTFAAYGPTDTYTTNNLNQYASRNATQAAYDTKGNMTTGVDGSTYQYDAQNRLTSATKDGNTLTFKYDGLNRQVSRKLGTASDVYSVWDGWNLIEHIQDGSVTAAFLSGATGMIKNLVTGNYYYQDASGSTSHLASNAGQLLEWYRYDLQGAPLFYNSSNSQLSASAYGIKHLFTGQQWYITVGLYDLRNRFYSPDIGRFLQSDPIGFGGDSTNLYRYCGNNPVNWNDPSGLQEQGPKPPKNKQGAADNGPTIDYNTGAISIGLSNLPTPATAPTAPGGMNQTFGQFVAGFSFGTATPGGGIGGGFSGGSGGGHAGFSFGTGISLSPNLGSGVGSIYARSFSTTITGTSMTAMELMNAIQNNINSFANAPWYNPVSGVNFNPTHGSTSTIMLGNTYSIDLQAPGVSANVLVTNVTSTSFTLSTFSPHPEAGSITFSASNPGAGTLSFQVNSMFQSSSAISQFRSSVSWGLQGSTWQNFSSNVITYSGGEGTTTQTSWGH